MNIRDKQILRIALPSIVSNITVPLLGLIDVTIVGHLGAASYIGAIAVGGTLFNIIYWLFAFLRMGTSGMTSQALGRRDLCETLRLLMRSVGIALAVAVVLLALQIPVREVALSLINPTEEVRRLSSVYFNICIWGAPAMLSLYALTGWFLGMQNSRAPMAVAIAQNVINIVASLALVYGAGMKVEGVALGTVIAQYGGLLMAVAIWVKAYGRLRKHVSFRGLWKHEAMASFFKVNRDIFLRTLCLIAVHFFFISAGASQGDLTLAVNTLLMQLFTLYSYVMDGFAFAGEALAGKAIGAGNGKAYTATVRHLFGWGCCVALIFTLIYAIGGASFLRLLTDDESVVRLSSEYHPWTLLFPVCGMAAFIWDGIFIGATASRQMLVSMFISTTLFFIAYFLLREPLSNHGLWLSFVIYLTSRGLVQTFLHRKMTRS